MTGPWAEGDPLTPTNLNSRGGGNFPDRTYHVNWATGSGETQITNAIANAVALGYSEVYIPKSKLVYDSSLVTFNASIRMTCEGGQPDAYDCLAYGIAGSPDCSFGIQAALDAAAASTSPLRTVWCSPGRAAFFNDKIPLGRPLWIKGAGTQFLSQGAGVNSGAGVHLYANGYTYGPTMFIANSSATVPTLVTQLATGTGSAWKMSASARWFSLRDAVTCDIDGHTQLCVEFFYNSTTGADGEIVQSGGKFLNGDTTTGAVHLLVTGGAFQGDITTSNGHSAFISGGTVPAGVTQHVALTYDGTTLRLFVAGVLVASSPTTGTISQGIAEDFIFGGAVGSTCPEVSVGAPAPATIDSFRVSNTARYTAAFTPPTAKFVSDANTDILFNFDSQIGSLTRAYTRNGDAWMWCRQAGASVNGVIGCEISGFIIGGATGGISGIFVHPGSNALRLSKLHLSDYRNGIHIMTGDSYRCHFSKLFLQGGTLTRYGFIGHGAQLTTMNRIEIVGGVIPAIIPGAVVWDGADIQADSNTVFHLLGIAIANPNVVPNFTSIAFDTEVGIGSNYRANFAVTGSGVHAVGAHMENCDFTSLSNKPYVISDFADVLTFDGCTFAATSGTPTCAISQLGVASRPAMVRNYYLGSAFVPWSDTTGGVILDRIGTKYSSSTGSTLRFDAALADAWDLTLTSDVTQSSWQSISYGQPVSGAIKMDSTGSRLFVWPTNSKGTATLSYGSAAVNTFTGFYDGVNVILTSVRTGL